MIDLTDEQQQALRRMFGFIPYDDLMINWASTLPEELRQHLPDFVQDIIKARLAALEGMDE